MQTDQPSDPNIERAKYVGIGIALGVAFGVAFGNVAFGMFGGVVVGYVVWLIVDWRRNKGDPQAP
jgi:hypothetical protein